MDDIYTLSEEQRAILSTLRKFVSEVVVPRTAGLDRRQDSADCFFWTIVTKALEMHGGHGYMWDSGVEKLVRDAAAFLHSDGANRTLLLKAAKFIR